MIRCVLFLSLLIIISHGAMCQSGQTLMQRGISCGPGHVCFSDQVCCGVGGDEGPYCCPGGMNCAVSKTPYDYNCSAEAGWYTPGQRATEGTLCGEFILPLDGVCCGGGTLTPWSCPPLTKCASCDLQCLFVPRLNAQPKQKRHLQTLHKSPEFGCTLFVVFTVVLVIVVVVVVFYPKVNT